MLWSSYREVPLLSFEGAGVPKWTELKITTNSAAPADANDFSSSPFAGSARLSTTTLLWRVFSSVLEVLHCSLERGVVIDAFRFYFNDSIVPGVDVLETDGSSFATLAVVGSSKQLHILSIPFTHNGFDRSDEPYCNTIALTSFKHSSATCMCVLNSHSVAIGAANGNISLVELNEGRSVNPRSEIELSESGVLQRLWTGLLSRTMAGQSNAATVLKLLPATVGTTDVLLAVSSDAKLRIWNLQRKSLIVSWNVLNDQATEPLLVSNCFLSLAPSDQADSPQICVALPDGSTDDFIWKFQYLGLSATVEEPGIAITADRTVFGLPQHALTNMSLAPNNFLWTLWAPGNGRGQSVLAVYGNGNGSFETVYTVYDEIVQSAPEDSIVLSEGSQESYYLHRLFSTHRFTSSVLIRALQSVGIAVAVGLTLDDLEKRLPQLGSDLVRSQIGLDHPLLSNEEQLDLLTQEYLAVFYSRLLQLCTELSLAEQTTYALLLLPSSSLHFSSPFLMKRTQLSAVRPVELSLETLFLSARKAQSSATSEQQLSRCLRGRGVFVDEKTFSSWTVVSCSSQLAAWLGPSAALDFDEDMLCGVSVTEAAATRIQNCISGAASVQADLSKDISLTGFLRNLSLQIGSLQDPVVAFSSITAALKQYLSVGLDASKRASSSANCPSLISVTETSLQQVARSLYELSRDVLLMLVLVTHHRGQSYSAQTWSHQSTALYAEVIPELSSLVHSFFLIQCLVFQRIPTAHVTLSLSGVHISPSKQVDASQQNDQYSIGSWTVLQVQHRTAPEDHHFLNTIVQQSLSLLHTPTNSLAQSPCQAPLVAEMLALRGAYPQLQQYLALLKQDNAATAYLSGLVALNEGSVSAAQECFLEAAGLLADFFSLANRSSGVEKQVVAWDTTTWGKLERSYAEQEGVATFYGDDEEMSADPVVHFFLHVIRMCEQRRCIETALVLAYSALAVIKTVEPVASSLYPTITDSTHLSLLWSIVFKHALSLNKYEEAFAAVRDNPDQKRAEDSLRRLVVTLCEKGQLALLNALPFSTPMNRIVQDTLAWKARTSDVLSLCSHRMGPAATNYFDIAYAFLTYKNDHRGAGLMMYELHRHAELKLQQTSGTLATATCVELLQMQLRALLFCSNSLALVNPQHAYLVVSHYSPSNDAKRKRVPSEFGDDNGSSMAELMDDDSPASPSTPASASVTVVQAKDITQLYSLTKARLDLVQQAPSFAVGKLLPEKEMAVLLSSAGLVEEAVQLCSAFELPLSAVFEALTRKCVLLQSNSSQSGPVQLILESDGIGNLVDDKSYGDKAKAAWHLLQSLLFRFDSNETNFEYHATVAETILRTDKRIQLPHWLVESFCGIRQGFVTSSGCNPAKLVKTYLKFGLVSEAASFIIFCKDRQRAAARSSNQHVRLAECFPIQYLDQTLFLLKQSVSADASRDGQKNQLLNQLQSCVEGYIETC
eukprot:GILJ01011476.1.p1 GENE.GILJ01011476.1~~GILJ01011476.1.p1  ORF type:complete len:1471 (-),score=246.59 GILJ01011476.1:173-4546(-)